MKTPRIQAHGMAITPQQRLELRIGPVGLPPRTAFTSERERLEAWREYREELIGHDPNNRRAPWGRANLDGLVERDVDRND